MVLAEVLELPAPEEPELREAMEEEDRPAPAAGDVVQSALGQVRVVMFEFARRDDGDTLSRSATLASVDEHDDAAQPSVEVEIRGLSIYTHHGVSDAEQEVGQRLEFDLTFDVPDCDAVLTDRVDDTVDYSEVCDIVALAATEKSYRTLERLCQVVAGRLMERFDCESVRVRAAKPEPPLPYVVQEAGVEVTLEQSLDREPDDEEGV
jgi:7,8-dihydroneopterin aldolase/epimerase/oxygenase